MWAALKRAGCCAAAFVGYVNWACVLQHFQLQINSFSQEIRLSTSLLFKYKLFIKILSSSLNTTLIVDKHCSDVCCDEFLVPQIDRENK